jgi:D domain of beta-TrCP
MLNIGRLSLAEREKVLSEAYLLEKDKAIEVRAPRLGHPFIITFPILPIKRVLAWTEQDQTDFVMSLLARMCHHQHGQIDFFLKPMLQRDFISLLPSEPTFIINGFSQQLGH